MENKNDQDQDVKAHMEVSYSNIEQYPPDEDMGELIIDERDARAIYGCFIAACVVLGVIGSVVYLIFK